MQNSAILKIQSLQSTKICFSLFSLFFELYQYCDPGSDQGPSDLQFDALPTELSQLLHIILISYVTDMQNSPFLKIQSLKLNKTFFLCSLSCTCKYHVWIKRTRDYREPGSDRGPSDHKSDALPSELSRLLSFALIS